MTTQNPLLMSRSNEWFTPARYVEAARSLMGGIDCDPASCALANKTVRAALYYDMYTNGFDKHWMGRVWLNPPYGSVDGRSNQERWSSRLIAQYKAGVTIEAILLVNAVTGNGWFERLWDYPICFTDHRIRFYNVCKEASQPTHSNAFVYFGSQDQRFIEIFSQFGHVVRAYPRSTYPTLWAEGEEATA